MEMPMMNNGLSDREKEFFVTGVKTYVDVDDAMTEFRRLVQHQCRIVVSRGLDGVNQACGMHWTAKNLKDYSQKTNDNHYLGNQLEVKGLGGLYFCLRLYRKEDSKLFVASVFLYRLRVSLADDLWGCSNAVHSDISYTRTNNNLIFERRFLEDNIADFGEYLGQAITDFNAFISKSGGLEKYLVQRA
jgi:hypothetical protein